MSSAWSVAAARAAVTPSPRTDCEVSVAIELRDNTVHRRILVYNDEEKEKHIKIKQIQEVIRLKNDFHT
jgi:hypothetical protein